MRQITITVAAVTALLLAACGGGSSSSSSSSNGGGSPVTTPGDVHYAGVDQGGSLLDRLPRVGTRAGTTWGDGALHYSIAVRGNTFHETGGDAGRLAEFFTGTSHEGAVGTLDRADLTAAFGAS